MLPPSYFYLYGFIWKQNVLKYFHDSFLLLFFIFLKRFARYSKGFSFSVNLFELIEWIPWKCFLTFFFNWMEILNNLLCEWSLLCYNVPYNCGKFLPSIITIKNKQHSLPIIERKHKPSKTNHLTWPPWRLHPTVIMCNQPNETNH